MILPEDSEKPMQSKERNNMDIGQALSELILKSKSEGRLTCGVASSVKLLEMGPDFVLLCILPVDRNQSVMVSIQQTLVEAFCRDNDINLVKVDSTDKLSALVRYEDPNDNEDYRDYCCVLVQAPTSCAEKCEFRKMNQSIVDYYNSVFVDWESEPIIELPG
ncbi:Hypothetical predicted protein [Octopus vulgaris]|uniref:Ribosomal protein eL8/eL30/eS12/Gadd45 domain-containing protein n=2 Tax=Octopus TaxID=6643 RepID=A0AA36B494_OCTVU|nr:Hypothetical predicted protein [Octopus vulgaris]